MADCKLYLYLIETGENLRGDINQQLLLMFGFLCLDTSLFRLDDSLFLNLFIKLPFRNIGLDVSRRPCIHLARLTTQPRMPYKVSANAKLGEKALTVRPVPATMSSLMSLLYHQYSAMACYLAAYAVTI